MRCELFSASQWLYPDGNPGGEVRATLHAARGGYAALQLLVTGETPDARVSVSRPAASPVGLEIYRAIDVMVEENEDKWERGKPDYITREAPFRVFDPIRPLKKEERLKEGLAVFYLAFKTPRTLSPGKYRQIVSITAGEQTAEAVIDISVYRAIIPERETLKMTNWFSLANMADRHGLDRWSGAHWDMIARYGALMRRLRQTTFWITGEAWKASIAADGSYLFDFSRAEKLIRLYLGMGFTQIEGGSVCHRDVWTDERFYVTAPDGQRMWASDSDGYLYIAAFLKAWRAFLEKNGWVHLLIQHVTDEPQRFSRDDYYRVSAIVRQQLPGVPVVEATDIHDLPGAMDIYAFKTGYYLEHRETFEAMRKAGCTLWLYTCCLPRGRLLNRYMDKALIESRLLHWGNFRYDFPGYLHWGLNHYLDNPDPFEQSSPTGRQLPPGDTHIVYPGEGQPYGSMRAENTMLGAQDYELLRLLEKKDAALAREIAQSVVRRFDDAETDVNKFESARVRLLKALE